MLSSIFRVHAVLISTMSILYMEAFPGFESDKTLTKIKVYDLKAAFRRSILFLILLSIFRVHIALILSMSILYMEAFQHVVCL